MNCLLNFPSLLTFTHFLTRSDFVVVTNILCGWEHFALFLQYFSFLFKSADLRPRFLLILLSNQFS